MAAGHVEHLDASDLAKQRLSVILRTMLGELSVAQACEALHVCESRFHALRTQWLQGAIELLEPRRIGRPPKSEERVELSRVAQLESRVRDLQSRLEIQQTREEVTRILASSKPPAAGKKKERPSRAKEWIGRRRRQQQRQRTQYR